MVKTLGSQNKIKNYIIIYVILLVFLYMSNLHEYNSIVVVNDEFGYWGIGAYFAGKAWKDLFATTPYYSFGYSLLMVPFYLLEVPTGIMYQIMLTINAILIVLSFLLSIKCIDKLYPSYDVRLKCLMCFIIACYTNNVIQAHIAWTETLLYFLVWLLLYIFISNIENMTYFNIILGALVTTYMYCVHQRSIGIILVYIVLLTVFIILKKEDYKKIFLLIIIFGTIFYCYTLVKNGIVVELFTNDELVKMNNASGQTSKIINILTTFSGMSKFVQSFIGKFYYASVASFFLFPMALICTAKKLYHDIVEYLKEKKKVLKINTYIYIYIILSFLSILIITAISMYINLGRLDLLIYGRYMEMAIGPVLLVGLSEIIENSEKISTYIIGVLVMFLVISLVVDYGLIEANTDLFNSLCATVLSYFFETKTSVSGVAFIITISMSIPLIIFYFASKSRLKNASILIFAIGWLFLANFSGPRNQQEYIKSTVLPVVQNIDSQRNIDIIYYLTDETTDDESETYVKYLQVLQPDISIERVPYSKVNSMEWRENSCIVCNDTLKIPKVVSKNYEVTIQTTKLKLLIEKNGR